MKINTRNVFNKQSQFPFLVVSLILFLSSCNSDDKIGSTFKGGARNIGNGTATSWIKVSNDNKPEEIGLSISLNGLNNLPIVDSSFSLELASQKTLTPFDHVELDWNPHGHAPEHVYDKPHFDFHFYMITEDQQKTIPPYNVDPTKFDNFPAPEYMPSNYIPIPGGVPAMGKHWADTTSPELSQNNPQPFTQTFIIGTYDGKITFYEPMATLEFLIATAGTFSRDIPLPTKFAKEGYYPTKLRFQKTSQSINLVLDTFVYRQKS
jgi:hypothetical protein